MEATDQDKTAPQDLQTARKKWINFSAFETMDTEPSRVGLNVKRLAWLENCLIVGENDLRAVPGLGSLLAALTGETITKRFFAFFNSTDYIVCFCNSGAAYTVDVANGNKVNFASAGTFSASPDMTQWEDKRILIGDPTGGYCTYDGNLFITEGNVSPNITINGGGQGYASAPTVAISGGSGSGATATATITNGSVSDITLTNAGSGYAFDDILLVSFSGGTPLGGGVIGIDVLDGGYGYLHVPAIAIAAPVAGGTTATATATIALGRIVSINITNAGSTYAETPVITITPAGGDTPTLVATLTPQMDTTASAQARIWPFTIKPTTLAVYQGRVWLGKVRELAYTGTLGYDDVDELNAAGSTTLSDADVVHYITKLLSANNFLYIVCDQSIKQIGQISVQGTITQFSVTSLSSDQGTIYPDTVKSFNRSVVFANRVGIFGIFGASVEKISGPMTGVIEKTDFNLAPVLDVFDFFGYHVLLCLIRYNDSDAGARSLLMAFYNKRWSVISQGDSITGIVTAHLADREQIFSTEGANITGILADLTVAVDVKIQTALTANQEFQIGKRAMRIMIGQSSGEPNTVNASIDSENGTFAFSFQAGKLITWVNNSNQVIQFTNSMGDPIYWIVGGYVNYETSLIQQTGIYLGATIEGSFKNFHFNNVVIEYNHGPLMKSRNVV